MIYVKTAKKHNPQKNHKNATQFATTGTYIKLIAHFYLSQNPRKGS